MAIYLTYTQEGFLKKFPLQDAEVKIGRDKSNDIVIDDEFISRRHLTVNVASNGITVKDAGSANGFYVDNKRRKKALLKVGDRFKIGDIQFTLESGDTTQFTLSDKFKPEFIEELKQQWKKKPEEKQPPKTRSLDTIYKEIEEDLLKKGVTFGSFSQFTAYVAQRLGDIPSFGSLYLMEKPGNDLNIWFSVNGSPEYMDALKRFTGVEGDPSVPLFVPLQLGDRHAHLVYFPVKDALFRPVIMQGFLRTLAGVIQLLHQVMQDKPQVPVKEEKGTGGEVEIITNSGKMKDLIKQAKKIADSDIFILIQGESGTGKELFARLIHQHSNRAADKFVALNCAAIPENLLESELFGYEKGAFTGAYQQKKGKLELASGGTLVLDEIGDMPLNLQSKLLRALQEHEFYRLGGSVPIKVDLRIISLTHQDVEALIREKSFREDLYYRLVHRALVIPPLRERREDIPALINYFTNKFCQRCRRSINGFSVKAFEALVNFDWNGNIRQLENEINTIVNLTDDGEAVDFDILSDKLKQDFKAARRKDPGVRPAAGYNVKPEREEIIDVLEKHNWNKSHAARALNMTYHGLHKKMKKMEITKPGE